MNWLSHNKILSVLIALVLILSVLTPLAYWHDDNPVSSVLKTLVVGSPVGASVTIDYPTNGTDDVGQFRAAIAALGANGGKIEVLSGTYTFPNTTGTVDRAIDNITIEGMGISTVFQTAGHATAIFSAGSQANWCFRNFKTDAGGLTITSATNWTYSNIMINTTYYAYTTSGAVSTGTLTGTDVLTGTQSISDNKIVTVDQFAAADNDYAKFTASGIEGRSYAETKSDLGIYTLFGEHSALVQFFTATAAPTVPATFTGHVQFDNATSANVTTVYLSDYNAAGVSITDLVNELSYYAGGGITFANLYVRVYRLVDGQNYWWSGLVTDIAQDLTNNTGWVLTVTYDSSLGGNPPFANNQSVVVAFSTGRLPPVNVFGDVSVYGDGSDSDVIISANTTLTRDMYYRNLTVDATYILTTAGYRVFVQETLLNNGTIGWPGEKGGNGGNASGSVLGTAGTAGLELVSWYLGGSTAGGAGATGKSTINSGHVDGGAGGAAPSGPTSSIGGNGAAGGTGGAMTNPNNHAAIAGTAGSSVTAPTAEQGGFRSAPNALLMRIIEVEGVIKVTGGAGGAGGSSGTVANDNASASARSGGSGGGGGGGGIVIVAARILINTGTITANGGNGGNGGGGNVTATYNRCASGSGGGGGGGGGALVVITAELNNTGTITAAGGTGGNGSAAVAVGTGAGSSGGTGSTGSTGSLILLVG